MSPSTPQTNRTLTRRRVERLPIPDASADQRGFLVLYERPGTQLNLAEVYELAGMAVVIE